MSITLRFEFFLIWTPFHSLCYFSLSDDGRSVLWDEAEEHGDLRTEWDSAPAAGAGFAELPADAANARNAVEWRKCAAAHAYQRMTMESLRCPELKMSSQAGESEGDFRVRLAQALRERRDLEVGKLNFFRITPEKFHARCFSPVEP